MRKYLSMLSVKFDIIRFVIWKDYIGFCVKIRYVFYGNRRLLIEKLK